MDSTEGEDEEMFRKRLARILVNVGTLIGFLSLLWMICTDPVALPTGAVEMTRASERFVIAYQLVMLGGGICIIGFIIAAASSPIIFNRGNTSLMRKIKNFFVAATTKAMRRWSTGSSSASSP